MQKRALTVNFQRAVMGDGPPVVMEVAVNPLKVPSAPNQDATLVTRETQDVLLAENASVVFYLVPTDHPDLTERVTYRIAWREKYMGRIFSQDFVMPDFDCDFDDLQELGNIIGGTTYIQWNDRGRPNGVAGLNPQGQVLDADGNVVSGAGDAAVVQGNLDAEIIARQQADQFLRTYFLQFAQDQITQVYASAAANLSQAVGQLQNADTIEKAQRQAAVNALNTAIANLENDVNAQVAGLNQGIDAIEGVLVDKADLVNGKVPSSQLPDVALGRAVPVGDEAEMLALTADQIQPGDFAVRPDGIFFLNANPASQIGNWVRFQVSATVLTVNGQTGAVVLGAADVGARPANQPIPMADITGLAAALSTKVDVSVTNAINNRLQVIENDATIVRTSGGVVPRSLMGTFMAYINDDGQITRKDGTVINVGGGGGDLEIEDVLGLVAALAGKVDTTDPALTNPRTPTVHAASHASGGTDPITPASIGARDAATPVPIAEITGLQAVLTNNGLTSSSDLDGRVGSLETRVTAVEGGGPGGGGPVGTTVFWEGVGPTTDFDTVRVKSPFGFNGTNYYYDPAGAAEGEQVWPYLTPNGHLKFIARDETAPADAEMATEADLQALATLVDTKADQVDLTAANNAINTKASLAALATLESEVATKASQTDLNTTNDTLATKASQTALDAIATSVSTKASQTDLDSLATLVDSKASSTDLTTVTDLVSALQTGKADLTAGKVPLSQIPVIPRAGVDGLDAALASKADLTAGKVPLAQVPDITTAKVTGLDLALAQKADLVAGLVPVSQLPALAFNSTHPVANRAGMLALTTAQVQPGDVAVITATADKGSYILNATDPSVYANWVKLVAPDDAVATVNGQTGTVVLGPGDVGARASGVNIPQSEITGLVTALASKADQSALTAGLQSKTSVADVIDLVSRATPNKQRVDYVATANVSPNNQQSVDGVLVPLGAVVLLTAQASSVNNGLYTVNSGAWTRVADMAAGDYFLKGSQAVVASGVAHAQTVWLQTNNTGIVGSAANNWAKVLTAGAPPVYTASTGVERVGNDFRAKTVTGGGIQAVAGGLQLDPSVAVRKVSMDVPAGSTIVTLTHNLNTTDVGAFFRDKAAGDAVLLGWKPTGVNTISAEFGSIPTAGQWRCIVIG